MRETRPSFNCRRSWKPTIESIGRRKLILNSRSWGLKSYNCTFKTNVIRRCPEVSIAWMGLRSISIDTLLVFKTESISLTKTGLCKTRTFHCSFWHLMKRLWSLHRFSKPKLWITMNLDYKSQTKQSIKTKAPCIETLRTWRTSILKIWVKYNGLPAPSWKILLRTRANRCLNSFCKSFRKLAYYHRVIKSLAIPVKQRVLSKTIHLQTHNKLTLSLKLYKTTKRCQSFLTRSKTQGRSHPNLGRSIKTEAQSRW